MASVTSLAFSPRTPKWPNQEDEEAKHDVLLHHHVLPTILENTKQCGYQRGSRIIQYNSEKHDSWSMWKIKYKSIAKRYPRACNFNETQTGEGRYPKYGRLSPKNGSYTAKI
ncbi:hypothetical protein J437_LFUL007004 [Ladona fulva]|uniref:Uncharacterized protein n=1 Tax=Ladona fulva TaxID=123851 RepID=A0A8K0NZD7_LADFU|nr:hypothetical protein J437_LFUL007004 [Ladona fulva]